MGKYIEERMYDSRTGSYLGSRQVWDDEGEYTSDAAGGGAILVMIFTALVIFQKMAFVWTFYVIPFLILLTPLTIWNKYRKTTNTLIKIENILTIILWSIFPLFCLAYLQIDDAFVLSFSEKTLTEHNIIFLFLREIYSIFFPYIQYVLTHTKIYETLMAKNKLEWYFGYILTFAPLMITTLIYYATQLISIYIITKGNKKACENYYEEDKKWILMIIVVSFIMIFLPQKNDASLLNWNSFTIKDQPKISWSFLRDQNATYFDSHNLYLNYFEIEKKKKEEAKKIQEEKEIKLKKELQALEEKNRINQKEIAESKKKMEKEKQERNNKSQNTNEKK